MVNGYAHRALKALHSDLAHEVRLLNGSRCPCCGHPMQTYRKSVLRNKTPRDYPTVAHDHAVGMGGNPEVWVYACSGCNNDQKEMTFAEWSAMLRYREDPRADRVKALAEYIAAWCARRGVPQRFTRKGVRP